MCIFHLVSSGSAQSALSVGSMTWQQWYLCTLCRSFFTPSMFTSWKRSYTYVCLMLKMKLKFLNVCTVMVFYVFLCRSVCWFLYGHKGRHKNSYNIMTQQTFRKHIFLCFSDFSVFLFFLLIISFFFFSKKCWVTALVRSMTFIGGLNQF